MFVLMDLEWVENREHHVSPVQLAAMRTDGAWTCLDRFYTRAAPRDGSFHDWTHMAYTGGTPSDFLFAPPLRRALTSLQRWLREDDVICFWHGDAKNILKSVCRLLLDCKIPQRIVVLRQYVDPFLVQRGVKPGNAYRVCAALGESAEGPAHQAENDVRAMQRVLRAAQYPAELLLAPPPQSKSKAPPVQIAAQPYILERNANRFHRAGCPLIPADAPLLGLANLKYFFRERPQLCPACWKDGLRGAVRERNRSLIDRSLYRFVYAESSPVFHRRDCAAVLGTVGTIKGSVYYDVCAATGRRPCLLCHPSPEGFRSLNAKKRAKSAEKRAAARAVGPERTMNAREARAFTRYSEARAERAAAQSPDLLTEAERNDFFTLTQPRFAFFSAAGYQSFHQRSCPKLRGANAITGFSRFQDALRAGHTPCRLCRPTAKLDIECSFPIDSRTRPGESVDDLAALCAEAGYPCSTDAPFFFFETAVGRWKIDFSSRPYIVYHINRVRAPDNAYDYHRQPRLFLSLLDIFAYIQRHDQKLIQRVGGPPPCAEDDTLVK